MLTTALALAAGAVLSQGCTQSTNASRQDEGAGGQRVLSASEYFLAYVEPELSANCGVCHESTENCTPQFMAPSGEAAYAALKGHPGLVAHPSNSNLLHHGTHTGPALTAAQEEVVREWLGREFPEEPTEMSQEGALEEFGACMNWDDFQTTGMSAYADQQTEHGPCGSCHKTGEAGTWIGFNFKEMYEQNRKLPWIKRIVGPKFDESGNFIDLTPANRFVDKPELAAQCNSKTHPLGAVPTALESSLAQYFSLSYDRWKTGNCTP